MFEKTNKTFIKLDNEKIEYLLKNIRAFYWWTGRNLNLVVKHGYGEWHEVYADGGGAVGILKEKHIKDYFTRLGYELDTRDIKYISS